MRAGDPKPAPGSARFIRDRRRVQILVIAAYLAYTVYETDHELLQASDLYTTLGVPHDVEEKAIQSRFRRLTVQMHPDKYNGPEKTTMEALYINMKFARDILVDPAKRFAYDRFGPSIFTWQNSKTMREFVYVGATSIIGFYASSAGALILLAVAGYLRAAMFWRYLTMAALFVVELYIVSRPRSPWILGNVLNPLLMMTGLRLPYLQFQLIALLRKLTLTFFIALSQLEPLLRDPQKQNLDETGPMVMAQRLNHVDALTNAAEAELGRLLGMELMPFAGEPSAAKVLRSSLKEWLVQNTIRNDPAVKVAAAKVMEEKRVASPNQDIATAEA
jgi:hypothetical protein